MSSLIGLHVVAVEHDRRLALLEQRVLEGLRRRAVVERHCSSVPSGSSGDATVSQRNGV
jgi:hypothetical protein